jgi:hypothetical protein
MRIVVFAAKSPVWSYYMQTRIVAPTLLDAINHARACNEMWRSTFIIASDTEAEPDEHGNVEPATEPGQWPRGKFDMEDFIRINKRLRVIPAMSEAA